MKTSENSPQKKSVGIETVLAIALVLVGCAFFYHTSHTKRQISAAGAKKMGSRSLASTGSVSNGLYKLHFKTEPLLKMIGNKGQVGEAALLIDGKQFTLEKNIVAFDKTFELPAGSHNIEVKIWDVQKRLTDRQYVVSVGPALKISENK